MKPATPILRNEHYLDVMTGGSASLPSPILREERYLAKLAGMDVSIPNPVTIKEKYYAKICGMDVDVPTYTRNMPRIYAYMAKAAGQTIEDLPTAVTREQRYWFDYVSEPPATEHEYTGAVPYTFNANGEPLLDYLISGNMVQSGTPTPTNPIYPSETGDKTANLFDSSSISLVPVSTSATRSGTNLGILPQGDYVLSATATAGATQLYRTIKDGNNYTFETIRELPYTFTADGTSEQIIGTSGSNFTSWASTGYTNIMLNEGSTALPYEPYGYKLNISSASTTTPVYLGEVQSTRQIKKLVLTGEENFNTDTHLRFSIYVTDIKTSTSRTGRSYCSHYECLYHAEPYDNNWNNVYYQSGGTLYFHDRRFATVADFKTYLAQQYAAGTPVCVWYVLSTPQTAVVNEPLRKIGDYADTLSMEQAGVNIPTNNGSTTVDVETTLKPSEVYIKWKGV